MPNKGDPNTVYFESSGHKMKRRNIQSKTKTNSQVKVKPKIGRFSMPSNSEVIQYFSLIGSPSTRNKTINLGKGPQHLSNSDQKNKSRLEYLETAETNQNSSSKKKGKKLVKNIPNHTRMSSNERVGLFQSI